MAMSNKVLVVDDEPSILIPIKFLMEQNGYSVKVATSGKEAMAIIERFQPDLILLDIMLPQMDGLEICQLTREKPECQDIKIVFLSALGSEVDVAKGIALGADAYITKPFSNAEVIETVSRLLR